MEVHRAVVNAGLPLMTKAELKACALQNGGFEMPELNDRLFLHYRGFQRIENLEEYSELKALWLDSNGFQMIENLQRLHQLRCLYLQRNLLTKIENLVGLVSLTHLDLSENRISHVTGLAHLPNLSTLNLAKNCLTSDKSIEHLTTCEHLSVLDLSNNDLRSESVIDVLARIDSLVACNVAGNPVVTQVANFRKKCISRIASLRYMDKPVFELDRVSAEAWSSEGNEAEKRARKAWNEKKKAEHHQTLKDFRTWLGHIRNQKVEEKANGRDRKQQQEYEQAQSRRQERMLEATIEAENERTCYLIPPDYSDNKVRQVPSEMVEPEFYSSEFYQETLQYGPDKRDFDIQHKELADKAPASSEIQWMMGVGDGFSDKQICDASKSKVETSRSVVSQYMRKSSDHEPDISSYHPSGNTAFVDHDFADEFPFGKQQGAAQ